MQIFQDRQTNDYSKTQLRFAGQGFDPRFVVGSEQRSTNDYSVWVYDEMTSKYIYTFTLRNEQSADAMETLLNEEVSYWDTEDYYTGENVQREAVEDYNRSEMSAVMGVFA